MIFYKALNLRLHDLEDKSNNWIACKFWNGHDYKSKALEGDTLGIYREKSKKRNLIPQTYAPVRKPKIDSSRNFALGRV